MAATAENGYRPHSVSILTKYYTSVESLRTYLSNILPTFSGSHPDTESFKNLLDTSYVGVKWTRGASFRLYSTMLDMREVVDQAQERLFKSKRPQNIITSGYRLARHDGERGRTGMARVGITNYFINTTINALYSPEWESMLACIGEDAMIHLLTETSIFLSLPNGCLCQITGEPVIHLTPSSRIVGLSQRFQDQQTTIKENSVKKRAWTDMEDVEQQPRPKRQKVESGTVVERKKPTQTKVSSPADINISRVKLFYTKPNYLPHSNRLLVGLPLRHVLNRLEPSYKRDTTSPTRDSRQISENTRHLSKYIFARQYGLHTPFSRSPTKGFPFIDYMDREAEIKAAGHCKTPKRLKEILPLLEKLIQYHAKCGYLPLRDISCPSKIKTTSKDDIESSVILEIMSETSIQPYSQPSISKADASLDSNGSRIKPFGLTQAKKHATNRPRFAEFACSYVEVYRYVVLVTNAIIPKAFWGSKRNLKTVLQYVMEFISCRRYETLSLHRVLQKFSTADCDWLMPPGPGARQQARVSVSDALKRRELLEDFLFWYFDSFVLPLLKTAFYVTDSQAFRNQVLYFRHDDWRTLCTPLIERLTSVTFEKLTDEEATEILRQRQLGFSFVRLLPKETGVRPIVNLRRRKGSGPVRKGMITSEQSINQILQAAFKILTYEKTNQPHLLGASIFSPEDIFDKLKKLKKSLSKTGKGPLPKLYFVKLDVQACFDTIDQTKLLQILRQIISEDTYMMQKYGQINTSLGRLRRNYVKKALPEDDHPHFLRYAADLATVIRNAIFVDQVIYPISKKQEILQLLEEHITENIVKIGQTYYRQLIGIPQGSVLSSILCSFFYGDMEKKFSRFTDDDQSALLRMIDDYLYVTTSLQQAKDFLDMMKNGHPEYGCFISAEKTLTNFDAGDGSMNVVDPSQKTFPWCGYTINMKDLSISADYTRYHGINVRSTLTIERGRKAGAAFANKLMQLVKTRGQIIFSDRHLNSWHVVHLNIYQNFLMTAVKMHEYLQDWGAGRWINYTFLRSVIEKTIAYSYFFIRLQSRQKRRQDANGEFGIRKEPVVWLGRNAFYYVLCRKPTRYGIILQWLALEIRKGKCRNYFRKFGTLVKEGQEGLAHVIGR